MPPVCDGWFLTNSGNTEGMKAELTKILGTEVTISGPTPPTTGSAIKVYVIKFIQGEQPKRVIVRDYRAEVNEELRERGIEIIGIDVNEQLKEAIIQYLCPQS